MSRPKTEKPSWDEIFLMIAALFSSKGTCDRLQTACVFAKNKRIVGIGYNGAIAGHDNCDDIGHLMINNHCLRTLHGEVNAVINTIDLTLLHGAEAFIIGTPCINCVKLMLQSGVVRIVYVGYYNNQQDDEEIKRMCEISGASMEQFTADSEKLLAMFAKAFRRMQGPGGIFRDLGDINIVVADGEREKI